MPNIRKLHGGIVQLHESPQNLKRFFFRYPTAEQGPQGGHYEQGKLMLDRLEMENPLSTFSGIVWDRLDIFAEPTPAELAIRAGMQGYCHFVNLLDNNATGFAAAQPIDLFSATLGSYQPDRSRIYITKLRRNEVFPPNPPPGNFA